MDHRGGWGSPLQDLNACECVPDVHNKSVRMGFCCRVCKEIAL